jgi:E3 ubiquitin-protein ligase RGLG
LTILSFGDEKTRDKSVFSFNGGEPCKGFEEVLTKYNEIAPKIDLSGPTSFAPAIKGEFIIENLFTF